MIRSELTESERRVWDSAETGEAADFREGGPDQNSPSDGGLWSASRSIRAATLVDLVTRPRSPTESPLRLLQVQGARITGNLDLRATTILCSLALNQCWFEELIELGGASAVTISLAGSFLHGMEASQLSTRGNVALNGGVQCQGPLSLHGAHIGGELICSGGKFHHGFDASELTVDLGIIWDGGFEAVGEVSLAGAHIGGQLNCTGAKFRNPGAKALAGEGLTVDRDFLWDEPFEAFGEVQLGGAHIGGTFNCDGGHFNNPQGTALFADGLMVIRTASGASELPNYARDVQNGRVGTVLNGVRTFSSICWSDMDTAPIAQRCGWQPYWSRATSVSDMRKLTA